MTSTTEMLADRQGLFSEVRRRSREVFPPPRPAEGPWVAVSRQTGSGGNELAQKLGAALGWHVFDREILTSIAKETRSEEWLLGRLDEKGVHQLDEYLALVILPEDPGQARYLVEMTRVIGKLARQGRAILVGRGANWFLTPECGLRVRAVAPLDLRAEALAVSHGIDATRARRLARENDVAQRAFVRQAWNREIDDATGYDLVINPLELGLPAAVETVVAAARAKLGL